MRSIRDDVFCIQSSESNEECLPPPWCRFPPRPTWSTRSTGALLDAISEGSLAPGERLTQEDIAQQLAVSRQPVLQALRLLKKDGFVQDAPGRGVLVAPLDADWMRKVYQVRGALDALAARLAAAQRFRIDPKLIEQRPHAPRAAATCRP